MRFERLFRLRKDVVVKDDESVTHDRTGVAQRLTKLELALAVGGQIFDQQNSRAFVEIAFDLSAAAEPLGLLSHVLHRQHKSIRQPCRERNARRFAAGDRIDRLKPNIAQDD